MSKRALPQNLEFCRDLFLMVYSKGLKETLTFGENLYDQLQMCSRLRFYTEMAAIFPYDTFWDISISIYSGKDGWSLVPSFDSINYLFSRKHFTSTQLNIISLLKEACGIKTVVKRKTAKVAHVVSCQVYTTDKSTFSIPGKGHLIGNLPLNSWVSNGISAQWKDAIESGQLGTQQDKFGIRIEFRLSSWATERILRDNARWLKSIAGSLGYFAMPTCDLVSFRLILTNIYCRIADKIRLLHPIGLNQGAHRALCVVGILLRGLYSKIENSSWARDLGYKLGITLCIEEYNFPFLGDEFWNWETFELLAEDIYFKIDDQFNKKRPLNSSKKGSVSSSITRGPLLLTEYAEAVCKTFYEEFWAKVSVWRSIQSGKTTIPAGYCEPITVKKLDNYCISYYVADLKLPKEDLREAFFNLTSKELVAKGLQGWKTLRYLQAVGELRIRLDEEKFLEVINLAVLILRESQYLPGFEVNGKFWKTRKLQGHYSLRLFKTVDVLY